MSQRFHSSPGAIMRAALATRILAVVAVAFILVQFVPAGAAENPPVEEDLAAAPEVTEVLRRACYDCHSNETKWPWYGRVAPARWLVLHDVREGREHLNFSTWNRYDAEERAEKLEEILEELAEGAMPPRVYTPLHPSARLSAADRALLEDWVRTHTAGVDRD
jgi:hypothetical protein